jgi:asparagine synthase (glutamine-hydrolysing)
LKISISDNLEISDPIQYWDPTPIESSNLSFFDAKRRFNELLSESVDLHMRSDVVVGAALSGGLDSSSVVSLMRKNHPDAELHTFSYIAADLNLSEEFWVDMIASHSRSISHKVRVQSPSHFEMDLDDLVLAQGEPMAGLSVYAQYKVFEMTKKIGIRVTLDGQGADELLAGYHGYPEARALSFLERGDFIGLISFLRSWVGWPGRSLPFFLGVVFAEYFPAVRRSSQFIEFAQKLGLMGNHDLDFFTPEAAAMAVKPVLRHRRKKELRGRRLSEALSMELGPKRLTALLRVADRNSMRFSTESRLPFLNRKLAEFALSLPEEYLLSNSGETKHILRQSMKGVVPDELLARRDKIGFEVSTESWGRGSKSLCETLENLEGLPLLNISKARQGLMEVYSGEKKIDSTTWRVLNYARWAQLENLI